MQRPWLPPLLLALFVLVWSWAAWYPLYWRDWLLENFLVFLAVPVLLLTFRRFRLSDLSYVLLFIFLGLHVVGSHWTYSNVPWPPWTEMGFERNHYDRVVHFAYGLLLLVPARELIVRVTGHSRWATYFAVESLIATSALYEIIEWIAALIVDPELGTAFLGAQGDEFDGIADMAMAGLGAVLAAIALELGRLVRRRRAPVPA